MADREVQEEQAPVNNHLGLTGNGWDKHRDDALVTISDDSDEELSIVFSKPAQNYEDDDDDDDDVVILEDRNMTYSRPDLIRPAAVWHDMDWQRSRGKTEAGVSHSTINRNSLHCQPAENNMEPEHNGGADILSEPSAVNKDLERTVPLPKTGMNNSCSIHMSLKPSINKEPICLRPKDELEWKPHVVLTGDIPSVQKNSHSHFPCDQSAVSQEGFIASGHIQGPKYLPSVNREAQLDLLGQAFLSTQSLEDCIQGPASPPISHPPVAPGIGQQYLLVHDHPGTVHGPVEPHLRDLPNQESAGLYDTELILKLVKETESRFPDVKKGYVKELILSKQYFDLNVICNALLEMPDYPKIEGSCVLNKTSCLLTSLEDPKVIKMDLFNFEHLVTLDLMCVIQAADLLMADFKMLSSQDIKWALHELKGHYAITRKAFSDAIKKWQEMSPDTNGKRKSRREMNQFSYIDFKFEQGNVMIKKRMFFLENKRRHWKTYDRGSLLPAVLEELEFYEQKMKEMAEHADFLLALQVNEEQYEQDGQMIECRCCYGSFAFEDLTQCTDGHLFCKECLIKYAQEAAFGSGQPKLSCLEGTCVCDFPTSELEKVLPENILQKYYERKAEEDISAACADQLVRCPSCSFPALLDRDVDRFSCPNPHCRKETCKKCQKMWKEHVNLTCEELAESDDVKYRTFIEEKMTAARVRKCHVCFTGLIKSEGCNRMSCRCGAQMCYLCRTPINGYDHFCQHPHSPGAPCRECTRCSLWTDPSQDDERLIQEIQREAEREQRRKKGEKAVKRIGPPILKNTPKAARIEAMPRARPQILHQHPMHQFPLIHPAFPLPPVQPLHNNLPVNLVPRPAPYVPPLPNIRLNYNAQPFNLEIEPNLPMHFGPQPRRE